jgi:tetratricopeptide (TPR) repeat protein
MKLMKGLLLLNAMLTISCASTSQVIVRSQPVDATVYFVDTKTGQNAFLGKTPLTIEKENYQQQGEVIQLRVEKDGFEPKYTAVASFGGQTTFLDIRLNTVSQGKSEMRQAFEASRVLLAEANRLVIIKRFSEALSKVEKILEMDPKNADAYSAKGSILYLMKDFDGAEQSWTRALELNPSLQQVRTAIIDLNLNRPDRNPASTGVPTL